MSLNCMKCFRYLSLAKNSRHSNVWPIFIHKTLSKPLINSFSTIVKHKNTLNLKTFDSIQAMNYSNDKQISNKCWNCNHLIESKVMLFCNNCHSIQSLDWSLNYFDLFEQKVSFDLDLNQLNKQFKSLQMSTHPDRYALNSDREHKYSSDNCLLINKAYKTLRDPYERGLYLLNLSNESIEESNGNTGIDSQFLTNIMALNEDIEENVDSKQELLIIFNNNKQNINKLTDELSDAFNSNDIFRAKQLLTKFKFLLTLDSNLKQKLLVLE